MYEPPQMPNRVILLLDILYWRRSLLHLSTFHPNQLAEPWKYSPGCFDKMTIRESGRRIVDLYLYCVSVGFWWQVYKCLWLAEAPPFFPKVAARIHFRKRTGRWEPCTCDWILSGASNSWMRNAINVTWS